MSNTKKDYAKSVIEGYEKSLSLLYSKYTNTLSKLDSEYKKRVNEIEKEKISEKNMADASNKISLANTKKNILEKGLSKSGESIQAELDSNLAKNFAFSKIEENKAKEKSQAEKNYGDAVVSAHNSYLSEMSDLSARANDAYLAQLNADRKYEAERDDEAYRREKDLREYEAERDDEAYRREKELRDYEAERDDEAYRREKELREYEAERDDEAYQRKQDTLKQEGSSKGSSSSSSSSTSEKKEDDRIEPSYKPRELVDRIREIYLKMYFPTNEKRFNTIREVIDKIVVDQSLTYDYRYQVKLYAKALGLY